jgi:uncharacterized damage-inducible protein DinB
VAKAPTSNVLDILLAHDAWATRQMLGLCRPLSREQFHQRFPIGLGSLHNNLTHVIGATRRWTDRLAGRTLRPPLLPIPERPDIPAEPADRTPDQLIELHAAAAADLAAIARQHPLETTISLKWPAPDGGQLTYTFTRAAVLVHVSTHSVHHRAQCSNMLRHLNVAGLSDKLPDLSAVDWQAENEIPPTHS